MADTINTYEIPVLLGTYNMTKAEADKIVAECIAWEREVKRREAEAHVALLEQAINDPGMGRFGIMVTGD